MTNITMTYKRNGEVVSDKNITMGEHHMSELGFTSVRYQKTINMDNYESLVLGVEVQLPNDPNLREAAEDAVEVAFIQARNTAQDFMVRLEERFKNLGK